MTTEPKQWEAVTTPLALMKPELQRWLWENLIPENAPTLIAGRGGKGKSLLVAWITAQLTQGKLPGHFYGQPVAVGIIAGEDDDRKALAPRLIAAGADPQLTHTLKTRETGSTGEALPLTLEHLDILENQINEHGLKVVIADPLISMQAGDSHKLSAVRQELNPLYSLCQSHGISMIWVHHFNKGTGDASNLISGSHAYRDIAKSVLLFDEDEDTGRRILSIDKGNYTASENRKSYSFTVETVAVDIPDTEEKAITPRVVLDGLSTLTVSDIVRRDVKHLGETRLEILEYAATLGGQSFTIGEAADAIGETKDKTSKTLQRMEKAGELAKPSHGRYTITADGLNKLNRLDTGLGPAKEQATGAGSPSGIASVTTPTGGNIGPAPVAPVTELKPKRGTYGIECPTHNYPTYKGDCAKCAAERAGVEIG